MPSTEIAALSVGFTASEEETAVGLSNEPAEPDVDALGGDEAD